jgi:caffeoyl-CoA O-methyltransferase
MSFKTTQLTEPLYEYLLAHGVREGALLRQLREETRALPNSAMQIAPDQGQFLQLLVSALGVKHAIEVGVFTGYSTLCTALSLPEDGRIVACDIDAETTGVTRRYFAAAGLSHKLDLRLGPAVETLHALLQAEGEGGFDFAFIDADKEHLRDYYELCLRLVRPGALVVVDNVLWGGSVIDPNNQNGTTRAIREFNAWLVRDTRVQISMIALADGLTMARKLP